MRAYLLIFLLLPSIAFANYVIGNLTITGVGSTTAGLTAGNIGVGSLSPGQTLDVIGTIRASSGIADVGIGTSSLTRICISSTTNLFQTCP